MNRRTFLRNLAIGAGCLATPKFIFDMGKNAHLYTPRKPHLTITLENIYCGKQVAVPMTMTVKEGQAISRLNRFVDVHTGELIYSTSGYVPDGIEMGYTIRKRGVEFEEVLQNQQHENFKEFDRMLLDTINKSSGKIIAHAA